MSAWNALFGQKPYSLFSSHKGLRYGEGLEEAGQPAPEADQSQHYPPRPPPSLLPTQPCSHSNNKEFLTTPALQRCASCFAHLSNFVGSLCTQLSCFPITLHASVLSLHTFMLSLSHPASYCGSTDRGSTQALHPPVNAPGLTHRMAWGPPRGEHFLPHTCLRAPSLRHLSHRSRQMSEESPSPGVTAGTPAFTSRTQNTLTLPQTVSFRSPSRARERSCQAGHVHAHNPGLAERAHARRCEKSALGNSSLWGIQLDTETFP